MNDVKFNRTTKTATRGKKTQIYETSRFIAQSNLSSDNEQKIKPIPEENPLIDPELGKKNKNYFFTKNKILIGSGFFLACLTIGSILGIGAMVGWFNFEQSEIKLNTTETLNTEELNLNNNGNQPPHICAICDVLTDESVLALDIQTTTKPTTQTTHTTTKPTRTTQTTTQTTTKPTTTTQTTTKPTTQTTTQTTTKPTTTTQTTTQTTTKPTTTTQTTTQTTTKPTRTTQTTTQTTTKPTRTTQTTTQTTTKPTKPTRTTQTTTKPTRTTQTATQTTTTQTATQTTTTQTATTQTATQTTTTQTASISLQKIKQTIYNKTKISYDQNPHFFSIYEKPIIPNIIVLNINEYEPCTYNKQLNCWKPVYVELETIQLKNVEIEVKNFLLTCLAIETECSFFNTTCYKRRCLTVNNREESFLIGIKNDSSERVWIAPHEMFFTFNSLNIVKIPEIEEILNNVVNGSINFKKPLLFINLQNQNKCFFNNWIQCWSGIKINNFQIQNVFVPVTFLMENCLAIKIECPSYSSSLQCFKRICLYKNINQYFEIYINQNNEWYSSNIGDVIFELDYGNFHSSWQNNINNSLSFEKLNIMEKVQEIIKQVNIFTKISLNELHLSYVLVQECNNLICNWVSFYYSRVKKEHTVYSLKSEIKIDQNHNDFATLIHERIHEFIRSETLIKFKTQTKTNLVYTGLETINMVIKDQNNKNLLQNGLILQDHSHLGNWGIEASPSSADQLRPFIGKYTLSVMKEIGYEMLHPINEERFISSFSTNYTIPFCKVN